MKCPDCGHPQDRSDTLVPGVIVFRCRDCHAFRIGGDDQVVCGGTNVMDRLRSRANEVLAERRHNEMIESDSDDQRWESWVI